MKIYISMSRKQIGELYHGTRKQYLLNILRTGMLELTQTTGNPSEIELQRGRTYFSSMTRSRFGEYHFKSPDEKSLYEDTDVMVTFDGTKLSDRYKIIPVDYWRKRGQGGIDNEIEERLVSNKSKVPVLKYIKRVDFIQPAVLARKETYGFDKGKYKFQNNEFLSKYFGSVLLQLKKNRIPYAFYNNMRDWAMRRHEYTYIGKKEVSINEKSRSPLSFEVKDLLALVDVLSDKPYSKLSEEAQKMASDIASYPQDIGSKMNVVTNNRKPDVHPYIRKLVSKVGRILQRKKLNTEKEIANFIGDKAREHYKQEQKRHEIEMAKYGALEMISMFENDPEHWKTPPQLNKYASLLFFFSTLDDPLESDAVYTVTNVLKSSLPEVVDLKRKMTQHGLRTPEDLVEYLFDKYKTSGEPLMKIAASTY